MPNTCAATGGEWVQTTDLPSEKIDHVTHKPDGEVVATMKDGSLQRYASQAAFDAAFAHGGSGLAASTGAAATGAKKFSSKVLSLLSDATGIKSGEAWANIMGLIAKSEQDQGPAKWDLTDKGGDLFTWSEALSYDRAKRGLTVGLVGFTTDDGGKPNGDAQRLFKDFAEMGGKDLRPMAKNCATSKSACDALSAEIKKLKGNDTWNQAQWHQLFLADGYIHETMKLLKARGFSTPSALTVGALFDCSLNQGNNSTRSIAKKVPDSLKEEAFLKKFLEIREPIAGTSAFNDPACNGHNRVKQFEALLNGGHTSLINCDAAVKKAISWTMK